MNARENYEALERRILSPHAQLSAETRGRERREEPCSYRTGYQRDRDRILHSKAFRRLKHKTQVFLLPEGDHYRTRMTHTLEVTQIARTIARALQLNEDLTEAIAMGHDLGHAPFGHAGERALNVVMEGGFRHYEQSIRVVERLENDGKGLNLTWEVRDGILCHTTGTQAQTLEGRIVRVADHVAYINHDIDDAIRAGVFCEEDIPEEIQQVLGETRSTRFNTLVTSIIDNSTNDICMEPRVQKCFDDLHAYMFQSLYYNPVAKSEESKVQGFIEKMFLHFVEHPDELPEEFQRVREQEGIHRAVCDYIAGMTDTYALEVYQDLFIPQGWNKMT